MTDGIDPTRLRKDTDFVHTDPPPVHKAVSQRPAYPDDLADASFGPMRPAKKDVSAQRGADPAPSGPIQTRLEAFLERATPSFTLDGKSVRVPLPFRMTVKPGTPDPNDQWQTQESVVKRNEKELRSAAASVGLSDPTHLGLLRSGRATPEDVQKVTQALIDRGRLPAQSRELPDAASRVRQMMFDYGLGIDCAGFVQQDLLASRGLRRDQTRLKRDISNEDLTNLSAEGFRKVPIDAAQPGDILVLDPPPGTREPGHTLIVYDRREATAEELTALRSLPEFASGHVTAYVLDSSFGSKAKFNEGGVMRQIWWRNDDNKSWARQARGTATGFSVWPGTDRNQPDGLDQPYFGHRVRGLYRPAGETP